MPTRDLELLFELGSLRFIQRSWVQFLGPKYANLAEHHLRVIWIAILLAQMEKKGDIAKIIKMALVHDVAESRTGDVHYISRQYTKRDEHKAIRDVFKNTSLEQEMIALWDEYEERKSIESKIVKDADFLDVDLEICEQHALGVNYMNVWKDNRKIIYELFHTASAKKLWKAIQKSSPIDWFKHARNRFVEGDLKKQITIKRKTKRS
jgi:putative hydrolase of HD superfamily